MIGTLFGGLLLATQLALPVLAEGDELMQLGAFGVVAHVKSEPDDRVFFAEGSAELGTRARAALDAQAAWRRAHTVIAVSEGHADDFGSARDNLEITQKRALAVCQRLSARGVMAERIVMVAFGRTRRAADSARRSAISEPAQHRRTVSTLNARDLPDGTAARSTERY